MVGLLAVWLWASPVGVAAPADDWKEDVAPQVMAEYNRLTEEIRKLYKRQVWSGVERRYQELLVLNLPVNSDHLVAAAWAARSEGNISSCYERLRDSARLEESREVIEWLWSIDSNFGRVELSLDMPPKETFLPALEFERFPLEPDQRAAIGFAQDQVAETGSFTGMLPLGEYFYAGIPFRVSAGERPARVIVSPESMGR